jgi:uncharacterized protein YndB with AHSA1/START domain
MERAARTAKPIPVRAGWSFQPVIIANARATFPAPIHDKSTAALSREPGVATASALPFSGATPHDLLPPTIHLTAMIKKILLGLVAIVVLFLVVAAFQPADFRVSRSATIAAPPATVFEQVNNLQNWNAWSPWAKLDPNAKNTFEGPQSGVGAVFGWAGNAQVGGGKMTITESQPPERIVMRLDFLKPFAATSTTEFTFKPEGDRTAMTWSMSGQNNFMGKCVSLLMNCDKMVGGKFEQGLANLRSIVEPKPGS